MNLDTVCGKKFEVSQVAFGKEFNESLVHQVVNSYIANGKLGTKAQKTRAEVRGGGKKPWRQKGSGRARSGTRSSPIWTGGGVTFAAKPFVKQQKVNKQMYKGAIRSMLSELLRQERLCFIDSIGLNEPKTKLLKKKLEEYDLTSVLIVDAELGDNLILSSRNLPNVKAVSAPELDPVSLISYDKVLVTLGAAKKIEELFG